MPKTVNVKITVYDGLSGENLMTKVKIKDEKLTDRQIACMIGDCIDKHWTKFEHQSEGVMKERAEYFRKVFQKKDLQ